MAHTIDVFSLEEKGDKAEVISSEWFDNMVGTRRQFVARLFAVFLTEEPKRVERIVAAHDRGDHEEIRYLAHSLKGAAATMGAERVTLASLRLERAAKNADLPAAGKELARLKIEMTEVYAFMQGFLESNPTPGQASTG